VASTRRLAAIMFTDMVGSTASARLDETSALERQDEQARLVRPLFASHQGREIKSMGDGFLAEFDSALHAVQSAIDIQQHLHERNSQRGVAPIHLRIGIHLGDVEQRETDIFGDAVNLASRIEPLASPGGVCISGEVYSQVRNKIPNKFRKLPPVPLKGIDTPIDVYAVELPWNGPERPATGNGPVRLAVLPFVNMSTDPADLYLADGLTEELITVLSQLRELRVIARTSVMPYKSTSKGVSQIGAELGVASVLEGSVRKAGNRLRVTAQLVEVASEDHLWARSYDREVDDVFRIQAELAREVTEALKVELRPADQARFGGRPAIRSESYLAYLKGLNMLRSVESSSMESAKAQFELAISLDERNAAAHAGLARATELYGMWHTDAADRDWIRASRRSAARAIELDPGLAEAHAALAMVVWDDLDFPSAEREFKVALSLSPSFSEAHTSYGLFLSELCRTEEALLEYALAESADPFWNFPLFHHARLLAWLGRFDEASDVLDRFKNLDTGRGYHLAAATYRLARGEVENAAQEVLLAVEATSDPREQGILRAWYLGLTGQPDQARSLLRQDPAFAEHGQGAHQMAEVYAQLGDLDECFRLLDKAVELRNIPIFPWRLDPRLANVRNDPRFQGVLKRLNLA
jgi:adenylate cyclase